jgi:hypothetical protein
MRWRNGCFVLHSGDRDKTVRCVASAGERGSRNRAKILQEATMKRIRTLFLLPILLAAASSDTPAAPVEKINICHINEVVEIGFIGTVISIASPAWPAHQRHFDYQTTATVGEACGIIE